MAVSITIQILITDLNLKRYIHSLENNSKQLITSLVKLFILLFLLGKALVFDEIPRFDDQRSIHPLILKLLFLQLRYVSVFPCFWVSLYLSKCLNVTLVLYILTKTTKHFFGNFSQCAYFVFWLFFNLHILIINFQNSNLKDAVNFNWFQSTLLIRLFCWMYIHNFRVKKCIIKLLVISNTRKGYLC